MKKNLSIICLPIIFMFISCKGPYFASVNNMRNIYSTVYTMDGKILSGQLDCALEKTYSKRKDYILFKERDAKETQKIYLTDVKGVLVRNNYYEPKLVDIGSLFVLKKMLFIRRLTDENSKIGLYEYRRESPSSGTSGVDIDYLYYISLPGADRLRAENIEGKHLTPNFENKMSEIVKDCPSLAEKIKRKDPGYFYAQISLIKDKKVEIMRNIIEEYNRCQ